MNPSARSSRLVSGIAVAAVCAAALGAMWAERGAQRENAIAAEAAPRPAADAPVEVVRAPAQAATQRPVRCDDCAAPPLRERSL